MKLKLELDLENPAASMLYLDDRKIGGIQDVTMSADVERNTMFVSVNGVKLRDEKEKRSWLFMPLNRLGGAVVLKLFGQSDEYALKSRDALIEALAPNVSKK